MSIINISNLNKYFKIGTSDYHVLRDVSLQVEKGEMVAIMGKSGSGKTTLLNILGMLEPYDEGSYTFNGEDVKKFSDAKRASLRAETIGFVNQDFFLLNQQTVIENVELPLLFGKCKSSEIHNKAVHILSDFGILDLSSKRVATLSGGEKQRVAIARAAVISPELLLADEPTGSLDEATANNIMGILKTLNKERGITIITVTHDSDVAACCDRTLKLSDGKLENK